MESINTCYVCSKFITENDSYSVILADTSNFAGSSLNKLLTDILDESVVKNENESATLCKKCYKTCTEYDVIEKRLAEIKNNLKLQLKDSLSKTESQNAIASTSSSNNVQNIRILPQKKVVVSSSKLMPLPASFQLNNKRKLLSDSRVNAKVQDKNIKLKLSPQKYSPSILSKTKKKSPNTMAKLRRIAPKVNVTIPNYTISTPVMTTNSPMTLNAVTVLPENKKQVLDNYLVMPSNDIEDDIKAHIMQVVEESEQVFQKDYSNVEENDESTEQNESQEQDNRDSAELIKLSLDDNDEVSRDSAEYMKVEILEHDDDDVLETIIMEEDESGSLIRVVSGQKIIYVNDEISVIIPDAESDKESDNNDNEEDGNCFKIEYDPQNMDDNDSQIELRAAGDEETANAIIQAASKRGGAFLKSQSGEMYRVESVATVKDTTTDAQGDNSQYIVKKVGKKLFKCLLCENIKNRKTGTLTFSGDAETVVNHVREVHKARVYICSKCGLIMRKCSDYSVHLQLHRKALATGKHQTEKYKLYECALCSKKFMSRNILIEHLNVHNKMRPYACDKCDKTFASKYTLKVHMKIHLERQRPFKCVKCTKAFFTQQNLSQHEKTHSSVKDFVCKICSKTFVSQHNLEMHALVHSRVKAYTCEFCDKSFARRAEIRDHRRTHTGEKPFPCDICGTRFAQRSNLLSHRRATHFDDRRYPCQLCNKRFKRRRLLDYHVQAVHTGERPFQCDKCKSNFVYPEHYRKHMRIHTGERPYECGMCSKAFNTLDTRNKHRFTHTQCKPYQCGVCCAGFMRKPQLIAHVDHLQHDFKPMILNPTPRLTADNMLIQPEEKDQKKLYIHRKILKTLEEQEDSGKESDGESNVLITKDGILLQNEYDPVYTVSFEPPLTNASTELFDPDSVRTDEGSQSNIIDASLISNQNMDILSDEEIIAQDESGAMVKLVHMRMENGETSWVALKTN